MNLYQLTTTQHALQLHLDAAGFDAQTIADTLDGEENTDALREKRLGYVAIIKAKRAIAAARNAAAASINELAEREAEAADRLETALFKSMQATGDSDLVGLEFEAHIKGKPAAVVINDPSKIPESFMRTPEPTPPKAVPDKTAIKAALQKGESVDGCELGPSKKLVIS
jgi:hypothetical protein